MCGLGPLSGLLLPRLRQFRRVLSARTSELGKGEVGNGMKEEGEETADVLFFIYLFRDEYKSVLNVKTNRFFFKSYKSRLIAPFSARSKNSLNSKFESWYNLQDYNFCENFCNRIKNSKFSVNQYFFNDNK